MGASILGPDRERGDEFGAAVDFDGVRAVVGAPTATLSGEFSAGKAAIFAREGGDWVLEAALAADQPQAYDEFGSAVAIAGDWAFVGANGDDTSAGVYAGTLSIYRWDGTGWSRSSVLEEPSPKPGNRFGFAVDAQGDRMAVSAISGGSWGDGYGVVYIYEFDGAGWSVVATLEPFDQTARLFGTALCLSGDRLVVGDSGNWLLNRSAGAAYMCEFDGTSWEVLAHVVPPGMTNDANYGYSVAIAGDQILVGAPYFIRQGVKSGAAYAFKWTGDEATFLGRILPSDVEHGQAFGWSVSVSGSRAIVGSPEKTSEGVANQGQVYVLSNDGDSWAETHRLTCEVVPGYSAGFGAGASMIGDTALVGAMTFAADGITAGAVFEVDLCPADCQADFNADGVVDTRDVLAYLNAWTAGDDSADTNGDGVIDTRDVLAFLNLWTTGC